MVCEHLARRRLLLDRVGEVAGQPRRARLRRARVRLGGRGRVHVGRAGVLCCGRRPSIPAGRYAAGPVGLRPTTHSGTPQRTRNAAVGRPYGPAMQPFATARRRRHRAEALIREYALPPSVMRKVAAAHPELRPDDLAAVETGLREWLTCCAYRDGEQLGMPSAARRLGVARVHPEHARLPRVLPARVRRVPPPRAGGRHGRADARRLWARCAPGTAARRAARGGSPRSGISTPRWACPSRSACRPRAAAARQVGASGGAAAVALRRRRRRRGGAAWFAGGDSVGSAAATGGHGGGHGCGGGGGGCGGGRWGRVLAGAVAA